MGRRRKDVFDSAEEFAALDDVQSYEVACEELVLVHLRAVGGGKCEVRPAEVFCLLRRVDAFEAEPDLVLVPVGGEDLVGLSVDEHGSADFEALEEVGEGFDLDGPFNAERADDLSDSDVAVRLGGWASARHCVSPL